MLSARGIISEREEGPAFVPQPCQKIGGAGEAGDGRGLLGQGGGGMGQPSQKPASELPPLKTRAAPSLPL